MGPEHTVLGEIDLFDLKVNKSLDQEARPVGGVPPQKRGILTMENNRLSIRMGRSLLRNEKKAVSEFQQAIQQPDQEGVIFFCSSKYNLDVLGRELTKNFDCPLIGCTTAGEISTLGYQEGGIVGASISSKDLKVHRHIISPLSRFSLSEAGKMASAVRKNLSLVEGFDRKRMFGFILIDGLSMLEETTITSLYTSF